MSNKQAQALLTSMLDEHERRENDFPVVNDLSGLPPKYRGMAVHINDHGNVTLYNCFKNGNTRELCSRV